MAPPRAAAALAPLAAGDAPRYLRVKRELQRLIESRHYAPGDALPSETVIATTLGVSIGTLRRAVDELVQEHVLVRRQGRGTFVALHGVERFQFQFFHVESRASLATDELPRERELPQVECVAFARGRPDDDEAEALRLRASDAVLRIENRLSLAGRPVVHDRIAIAAAAFRGLTEPRFRQRPGTVYRLYQSDFGLTVLNVRERVRAAAAGATTARILGIAPGLPVLEVRRIALTFGDRPVEYRVSTIHTAAHDYVSLLAGA
jgi:GntR family transcriptional regulator